MERDIEARRPLPSKSEGLSKAARIFFALNLFQVFAIGGIQASMIFCGNFKPVQEGGLGPGRKMYMALFLGAILYSCFLCLFAVKKQNFLEILAFVLQNYTYVSYSGIQVYHISFKTYEDYNIKRQNLLVYLTIVDSVGLLVLNIIFTCLAVKLYGEYGWKIYKRVRFNIKLRAAFHLYETVLMLLKMLFLFITMFAVCLNKTILSVHLKSFNYIASFTSIPVCLVVSVLGVIAIRREIRLLSYFFILAVFAAFIYYVFKIIRVSTKTCIGCEAFANSTADIPGEVELHVIYLGSVNLVLLSALLIASIKAVRNFGIGLAEHFKSGVSSKLTVLSLSKNILTSLVTSSAEDTGICMDLESPRPSVSNEPRPSIFQYFPKLISAVGSNNITEDCDQSKWLSLPAQLHKQEKVKKHTGGSSKSRISQIFLENDFPAFTSNRSSMSSRHYTSSCFRTCCPWSRDHRLSFSAYGFSHREERMSYGGSGLANEDQMQPSSESCAVNDKVNCAVRRKLRQRKRSRSLGCTDVEAEFLNTQARFRRLNSLPCENGLQSRTESEIRPSLDKNSGFVRCSLKCRSNLHSKRHMQISSIHTPVEQACLKVKSDIKSNNNNLLDSVNEVDNKHEPIDIVSEVDDKQSVFLAAKNSIHEKESCQVLLCRQNNDQRCRHMPIRRTKSSVTSLLSMKTDTSEIVSENESERESEMENLDRPHDAKKRKLGVAENPDVIRKALSDYDLYGKYEKKNKVHFG